MAAPTWIKNGTRLTKSGGGATSLAPTISCTIGNYIVALFEFNVSGGTTAIATPSGWTLLHSRTPGGSQTYKPQVAAFGKVAASTTETCTITTIGTDTYGYGQCVEWSGVASVDTTASTSTDNANGTATSATITGAAALAVADSAVLVHITAEVGGGGTSSMSSPASSGYTVIGTNANDSTTIAYDSSRKTVAVTTAPTAAWTWTGAARYSAGMVVLSGSAGGGGGGTLAVGQASFTLTGQTVGLKYNRNLPLGAATFTLTGKPVAFQRVRTLPLAPASFALSGQTVALRASRRLSLANASYALNGQAVALRVAHLLPLANASFVLSGQTVRMAASRRLALANAVFTLTGENVTLTKISAVGVTTMPVGTAHFTLSGQSVGLRASRRLALAPALFTIIGMGVTIAIVRLTDFEPVINSRGIRERRFGSIISRNRPFSGITPIIPSEPPAAVGNEGTWTPLDFSGAGLLLDGLADACRFVMINGLVHAFFAVVLPATVNTAPAAIGGLPALARDTGVPVGPVSFSYITVHDITGIVANGASMFNFYHTDGTPATNADLSGAVLRGCAIYEAAS
jgi:hypothetical protein